MSIYGWWQWTRKDAQQQLVLHISYSSKREWKQQLLFFGVGYAVIYLILVYLKKYFAGDAIPWADAFASAAAYTGMWLMTRKKVESWYWWIATNIASIPLYFSKHYVMTSVYYLILLVMAIQGLIAWKHNCKSSTAVVKK
jgi:nicotinamide mononucleotide transporter